MADADLLSFAHGCLTCAETCAACWSVTAPQLGELALLASVQGALSAIDAEAVEPVLPDPEDRAIVSDNNQQITLAVFSADGQRAAAVPLPAAVLQLAGQLLAAGVRRL